MNAPADHDGLVLGPVESDPTGQRAWLMVAAEAPWFAGHFPGHPVLPGIAHLAIAARLHQHGGGRGQLSGVDAMRFAEPVRPGDRLIARLTSSDVADRAHFRLERTGGGEVSTGTLVWGSPTADAIADAPGVADSVELAAPQLPHAPPARLLDGFAARGAGTVVGKGRVAADHPAVSGGLVPALLAVELAAQAAAQIPPSGGAPSDPAAARDLAIEPRLGYLVRLREVRFARARFDAEAPLVAYVDLAGRTGPLARFDFVVELAGGEPIAAGGLATWEVAGGG